MKPFRRIVKGFAALAMIYSVMLILDGCFGWGIAKAGSAATFPIVMVGFVVLVPAIYAFVSAGRVKESDFDPDARTQTIAAIRQRAAEHRAAVHDTGS